MSDDEVVETIYGDNHKYTVIKKTKAFGGYEYWIRRDDKPYKGSYGSLSAAVEAAEKEP